MSEDTEAWNSAGVPREQSFGFTATGSLHGEKWRGRQGREAGSQAERAWTVCWKPWKPWGLFKKGNDRIRTPLRED